VFFLLRYFTAVLPITILFTGRSFHFHVNFRVWQEWSIENNTFTSMLMPEGDLCGSRRRSTEVNINRAHMLSSTRSTG
jgi:hypothetical protein